MTGCDSDLWSPFYIVVVRTTLPWEHPHAVGNDQSLAFIGGVSALEAGRASRW
jgi:hypothetical protein